MMLQRFNPVSPVTQLRNELDRLVGGAFSHLPDVFSLAEFDRFPALNVWQDETNIFVEAEVPGMGLEDLEVLVQGEELTIKGNQSTETEDKTEYIRQERADRRFSRSLRLPVAVDSKKVAARLKDGVLKITLPKAQDVLPKKIKVTG